MFTTSDKNSVDFPVKDITVAGSTYITGIDAEAVPCGPAQKMEEASGYLHLMHPGVPFTYKLTKATYLPTLMMELSVPTSIGGTGPQKGVVMIPSASAATDLPGFDAAKASLFLQVDIQSGDCSMGGWTIALAGHPEAQVSYWTAQPSNAGTPTLSAAPANAAAFYVSMTKLDPAPPGAATFTLTGAAGTCATVTLGQIPQANAWFTGNVALDAGAVTVVEVTAK